MLGFTISILFSHKYRAWDKSICECCIWLHHERIYLECSQSWDKVDFNYRYLCRLQGHEQAVNQCARAWSIKIQLNQHDSTLPNNIYLQISREGKTLQSRIAINIVFWLFLLVTFFGQKQLSLGLISAIKKCLFSGRKQLSHNQTKKKIGRKK